MAEGTRAGSVQATGIRRLEIDVTALSAAETAERILLALRNRLEDKVA